MGTAPLNRVLGHLRVATGESSDADLLRTFLATQDSAAFSTLVRRHGPTVLAACRQVLRQESDVEDDVLEEDDESEGDVLEEDDAAAGSEDAVVERLSLR